MPTPSQLEIRSPLLEMVSHGREYRLRDMADALADHFSLTAEERAECVPSGGLRFYKKCGWAQHLLKEEGLLESTRRGYHRITERGFERIRRTSGVSEDVNEEAIRRIVREEIDRAKQELKSALREIIDNLR